MGIRQTVSSFSKRVVNRIPRYSRREARAMVNAAETFAKSRRGLVTQQYIETVDKIVDQPWPYLLLKKYANKHPFLRVVHGAIIREVVRNRWDVKEKFAKKCIGCGQEFVEAVEVCPDCAKITDGEESPLLRDPNPQEKKRLEAFLKNPNRDDEMVDIIKSVLKDNLAIDDWYLSMKNIGANQWVMYMEDGAEMFICADKHGRLGDSVWFCPSCWTETNEKTYPAKGDCEDCGVLLKETAYVQKVEGTIKARYGKDEIIHGNSDVWLPQLYGNSKVVAVLQELRTAFAMSSLNFDTYASGHLSKIFHLEGEDQSKATELAKAAKEQTDRIEIDSWTGRIGRKMRDLWVGSRGKFSSTDAMPDPEKMQSLEWMEFWFVKIVGAIYNVQPVMMNATTRGPGGYFQRQQIVVQNDATREVQRSFADPFNEQFVENTLGIHDWRFEFNEIEPRNEIEQAQIWQVKVAAGAAAKASGLDAELTDEGELKISGEFQEVTTPQGASHFLTPTPKTPKPPEPQQNVPFAMDKTRKGKSWLVTEINPDSRSGKSRSKKAK